MKYIAIISIALIFSACNQDFGNLKNATSLPDYMHEVSGIEIISQSDLIWMINDAGNEPVLVGYNPKTKDLDKAITIDNVKNKDWEDLAGDENGTIYIGDFGNNDSNRKDMAIYTIKNAANITGENATATITKFTLEDQEKFPPKKHNLNFDIESFIFKDGNFYLFSRNRSTNQFDGTVKLYRLSAKEGSAEAKLISDTFKACDDRRVCQITAADIDAKTGNIALLTAQSVYILSDYKGDDFFSGKISMLKIGHNSQKEGIAFKNSDTLYITDELRGVSGGNIYELPIENPEPFNN